VTRWAQRTTVGRTTPSFRTRRAWISTSPPSRAAKTCDDRVQVVGVDRVDPPGAQHLLGPMADEAAEGVVHVRQPHALLGQQRRHRRSLGEGGEAPLVRVGGRVQGTFLLVGRGPQQDCPPAAPGDGVVMTQARRARRLTGMEELRAAGVSVDGLAQDPPTGRRASPHRTWQWSHRQARGRHVVVAQA
jgi:hypothetical protein